MNCEAEQETSLNISFQWDSLLAGEQDPVHGSEGEESQADVSLPQVLETLLCRGTNNQAGRGKELETFHRAVNHGRLRKLNHDS